MSSPELKSPYGDNNSPNGDIQDENEFAAQFAERLRFSTIKQGFNQKKLASTTGLRVSLIGKYWHGSQIPKAVQLFKIADALRVNPRWLLNGEGQSQPLETLNQDGSGEGELLSLFRSIGSKGQEHLLATARLLWDGAVNQRISDVSSSDTLHSSKRGYRGEGD